MSDGMDCDGLRKVLFDHVDGLLGREEADAARDHLAACGPCRALQEEVRRNFTALDAWEDEDLPSGAFDRLRSRLTVTGPLGTGPLGTGPLGTGPLGTGPLGTGPLGTGPLGTGPLGTGPLGGPRPVPEIGTGSEIGADSPSAGAPAGVPRRRWLRLAVPYAAGLATAAAAAWVLFLPHGALPASSAPGPRLPLPSESAPAPVPSPGGAAGTGAAARASLRAGERKLEFSDVDHFVMRRVWLPGNMDPEKVILVDTPPRLLPDDRGVR
jgi:hypothetical protein